MDIQAFSKDGFFQVGLHPETKVFTDSEALRIFDMIMMRKPVSRLELESKRPQIPQDPSKSILGHPGGPTTDTDPIPETNIKNNSELLNTNSSFQRENEEKQNIFGNEFAEDGYRLMLTGLYDLGFVILSRKYGKDMTLTGDENKKLCDASIPLMKKYVGGDFKYGEEIYFAATFAGVFTTKLNQDSGEPMTEQKSNPDLGDVAQGIFSMLDQNKEKINSIPAQPVNDIDYKKIEKILSIMEPGTPVSREMIEKFNGAIGAMGVPLDLIINSIDSLGADSVRTMIKKFQATK